jgi:hypothetical protein
MEVLFDENSWHTRLYRATYDVQIDEWGHDVDARWDRYDMGKVDKPLPTNLCPYFWKVVAALFFLPLTWVGYYFSVKEDMEFRGFFKKLLAGVAFYLVLALLAGMGFMVWELTWVIINNWKDVASPMIGLAIGFAVALAGWFGSKALIKKKSVREPIFTSIGWAFDTWDSIIELPKAFFAARKKKYCPIIEWKTAGSDSKTNKNDTKN